MSKPPIGGGARLACNEPDFLQSVPPGRWTRVPDPLFPASYRYRHNDTAETVLVPAIWYNGLARDYARYLHLGADRCDAAAETVTGAWSDHYATQSRRQAARLRFMAGQYEAAGDLIAGHVSGAIEAATFLLDGFARGFAEGDL